MGQSPEPPLHPRRSDLDWLRALAVLLLVPFHSALVFNLDPRSIVYLKDVVHSDFLSAMAGFMHRWHMPLLFFIAGASTWLALEFRTKGHYLRERALRLLVPFAFCQAALIPPMTYIHLLGRADSPGFWRHFTGFWSLDLHDFNGLGGAWTPAHLWFILFLFLFSAGALPLFVYLRGDSGRSIIDRLAVWCGKPGVILIAPGVLLTVAAAIPLLGDKNPFFYIGVFILGGVTMIDRRFQQAIDRHLWAALLLGIAAVSLDYLAPLNRQSEWSWQWMALGTTYVFSRWIWVIAIISAGRRIFTRAGKVLAYAAEAAYPFYLLHLPVGTLVTYFVIRIDTTVAAKYALIVFITIGITLAVYELFITRISAVRFLIGMKPRARRAAR